MVGARCVGSVVFAAVVALCSCGGSSVHRNEDGGDPKGGAAGTAGTSSTPGTGGTSGTSGSNNCARDLPTVDCDYLSALGAPGHTGYCYKGGCHNTTTVAGRLDLAPDTFLASRLLNVPAKHD